MITLALDPKISDKIHHLETRIGNTPLVPLQAFSKNPQVQIFAKLEWMQWSGSVKARAAFNIVRHAVENGLLGYGRKLLDASSGNTAIAYAHICAALDIPLTIVLPENASPARKQILKSLGTELIFSSPFGGTDEAQELALSLYQQHPNLYYYADQYSNVHNRTAHIKGTATEIWQQSAGTVTHFVAGLGTTGTFCGTSIGLKNYNPAIQSIALQPESALHGMEGWKHLETAKVPTIYDAALVDAFLEIETKEAYQLLKQAASHEGLLLSPSAAANLAGAVKVAETLDNGVVVTVFPDNADKYLEILNHI